MRCKRCGEQLEPMDTRCPVCGKAVAPRKKGAAQKPSETSIKLPQLDKFAHAYSEDAARSRVLQLTTIAAVLAAIVLLVLVFAGVGDLKSAVNDLKLTADAQLQAIQNQQQPTQNPDPTEDVTEPQTQEEPTEETAGQDVQIQDLPLSGRALSAKLNLYRSGSGSYAAARMDLGGFEDRAEAWVSTSGRDNGRDTAVVWLLEKSGDRMDLALSEVYGGGYAVQLALNWSIQGDTFSGFGNPVCIWEYRVAGDSWETLSTEYLTPVAGGCQVAISADQLALLLDQYSEMELRCLVSMSHPSGGTMQVLVDGIRFGAAGLTVSGSLLD